jgi:hypothetical protein
VPNIINAIINVISEPIIELRQYYISHNRANSMGEALEEYAKDIFASTVAEETDRLRLIKHQQCFCYIGNQNNPPDAILRGGDAIEVKKIENISSQLALNSSYPKNKLYSDNPLISQSCRICERWTVKDMIYVVGVINNSNLSSLCMIYGDDYAADRQTYERIKEVIKTGVETIPNVEFGQTNELGRVNRVDPLGITFLRVRGMWGIQNPFTVFRYVYTRNERKRFNFMAIINTEKYLSLANTQELENLYGVVEGLNIADIQVRNPNNPSQLKQAKLITYSR